MKKNLCILLAMSLMFGLCACGQSAGQGGGTAAPAQEKAEEAPDVAYTVFLADPDGAPIPGAKVQFCDDETCTVGDTDENGNAVFMAKEGAYTVHVLKAPEGYIGTEEEFSFPDAGRELQITLNVPKPVLDRPIIGISYYNPEKYEEIKGIIYWEVTRVDADAYVLSPTYYTKDYSSSAGLYDVLCVHTDESEAEAFLKDTVKPSIGWDAYTLETVGTAGNLTCFLAQQNLSEDQLEQYKSMLGENYDEFIDLRTDKETFLSGIRLQEPAPEILALETEDLDGNAVTLSDVLAGHKVTMVNLWATWCEPCVSELPELQELCESFEAKDCQIIGICMDSHPGGDVTEAKAILAEAGVTYLNLRAPKEEIELLQITTFPTTYFVDSEGKLLTMPFEGAYVGYTDYVYSGQLQQALDKLEG